MKERVGAALSRDIATGEKVEAELDAYVSRRDRQRWQTEGQRDEEVAWHESERRVEAPGGSPTGPNGTCCTTWLAADRLRATLGALVDYHEAEAEKHLPKGAA